MKKSERRMILILVIVAIIVIAVLVKVRSGNNSDGSNDSNSGRLSSGTSSSDDENSTTKEDFVQVLDDGTRLNISNKLAETKTFGDYEISNIQLTESDGLSKILADVKNIGTTDAETKFIEIVVVDESGNELVSMNSMIGEVAAGETIQLNASATADFANAYDFTINFQ